MVRPITSWRLATTASASWLRMAVLAFSLLATEITASAQTTVYWDINGTTAGAGGATPSGNWRTSGAGVNWGNSAGTAATALWTNGNIAVFSAGADATGSFTVTVNSVTADSVIIEQGTLLFDASTLTLTGAASVEVASGLTTTFQTRISGGAGFVKAGTGTVVFQGQSKNYTGDTNINAGTLRLGAANMIGNAVDVTVASGATFDLNGNADTIGSLAGAGNVTLGAATLTLDGDGETTEFSGAISGDGGLAKSGTDTLILSGPNSYKGTTAVTAGVLNIRHGQALGTVDNGTSITSGEALQLEGGITVGAEALSLTGTGVSTTGALRNISGDNTFGGVVTLKGNTRIGSDGGTLTLSGGITGLFDLTFSGAGNVTVNSAITTGNNTLTKVDAGILTLSGANTYSGDTTVSAGTLRLGASNTLADATEVTVAAGATFDVNGQTDTVATIAGAGDITLGSGALTAGNTNTTFSGVMSGTGSFTKAGAGVLTLSGANTYSGATHVNAGTLRLGADNALADTTAVSVATGATLDLNNHTDTVATIAGAGNITLGSGNLATAGNASTTFSGVMSETGSFTKAGSGVLTLSGANTYSGDTNVNAGTLRLGASNVLANTTDVIVATGATFDVNGMTESIASLAGDGSVTLGAGSLSLVGNASTTFAGTLTGTLASVFSKGGTGVLTLTDTIDFDGTFELAAGTLSLGGSNIVVELGTLKLMGNTTIDFSGAAATLKVDTFDLNGFSLSIVNWINASDYFFAANWVGATQELSGSAPMTQVAFTGFTSPNTTKWQGYDDQITPVPEPSTYGALLFGGLFIFFFWRRKRVG